MRLQCAVGGNKGRMAGTSTGGGANSRTQLHGGGGSGGGSGSGSGGGDDDDGDDGTELSDERLALCAIKRHLVPMLRAARGTTDSIGFALQVGGWMCKWVSE